MESRVHNKDFENNKESNSDKTKVTNLSQNGLQVTNIIIGVTNKLSSTTKESVGTCANNDGFSFTLFNSRTRENFITSFLTNR
jgi:hypothetical protein